MRKVLYTTLFLIFCFFLTACTGGNDNTQALYHASITNTDGNPDGKVTLVEFYDPRCSTCRKMEPILANLKKHEPNVRIVYHEKPVLGPLSDYASLALIAAKNQDRYLAFRTLLMTSKKPLTKKTILQYAKDAQMNPKLLEKDINSDAVKNKFNKTQQLAKFWHVKGTPTFFIGIPGQKPIKLVGIQTPRQLMKPIQQLLGDK